MYYEHINWCLKLFTFLGVSPNKNDVFRKVHYIVNLLCPLTVTFLTVYMMYVYRPFKLEELGDVSTALTTFPHAVYKLSTLFVRKSEIHDLIERTRLYFWDMEDTKEIKRTLATGRNLKRVFFYSVVWFIFTTILKTVLSKEPAYKCFEPKWLSKYLFILFQDYTCCVVLLTLVAHDIMLQTLLILVNVQFKMLNRKLRNVFTYENNKQINQTETCKRIKECVDHHVFLMDFMERFKSAFSITILLFVGNIILSLCMSVYIILSNDTNLNLKIEAVVHTIAGLNELGLCYSIPAQLFMDEAAEVSNSVYFSNWYEHPKYAKFILPILNRNRRLMTITVGGIVMIDLKIFLVACKTIVSYSMFLNTMTQLNT